MPEGPGSGIEDVITGKKQHHVERGESLKVLRALPDACVDAVITDPPYSSGGAFRGDRVVGSANNKYQQGGTQRTYTEFSGDSKDQRSWTRWATEWLAECLRASKSGAPLCVFTDWRQLPSLTDAIQMAGWVWRGIAVWNKTEAARPMLGRFRNQAEYIVWGSNGPMPAGVHAIPGVFAEPVRSREKEHVAAKPVGVMRWLMMVSPIGGLVLDPFAGSGSTGVAAKMECRRCLLIEQVPEYVEISKRRVSDAHESTQQNCEADPFGDL